MLPHLNFLWIGEKLSYIEQISLLSAKSVGHTLTLYSYTPDKLQGAPDGIELRDAREVMPEERAVRHRRTGSATLAADLFRYVLLSNGLGYWVDMDLYFLKPLDFDSDYVFGWQDNYLINNAVLYAPADSAFVADLCSLPQDDRRPEWFGPRRSLLYYWARWRNKGHMGLGDMPWGTYGPDILTYVARKHGLLAKAQPASVFYPIAHPEALTLYESPEQVEKKIGPETRTVHMWHSRLHAVSGSPPPKGSYIDGVCRRFGIEP